MRTITGLFDSRPEAERAVETLVQEYGIDPARVQVHAAGPDNVTAGTQAARSEDHHGFLAPLQGLALPEQDQHFFGEGLRRGGILVAAEVPEAMLPKVSAAFERHGAVDLDAREAEWREGGWAGGGGGLIGGRSAGSSATPDSLPAVNPDAAQGGWTGGGGAIGSTAATRDAAAATQPAATYAGSHSIGARGTDQDIMQPVNAGIASSPPVRPAGPAAQAAAGAAANTATRRDVAAAAAATAGTPAPRTGFGQDPAIPEQTLRTGTRDVSQGSVRVRSYSYETPPGTPAGAAGPQAPVESVSDTTHGSDVQTDAAQRRTATSRDRDPGL
jgi:hypothetical protein